MRTIDSGEPDNAFLQSLRALYGKAFNLVAFSVKKFFFPYAKCRLCGKHITEDPLEGEVSNGYVRMEVVERSDPKVEDLRWEWICEECFDKYHGVSNWSACKGELDLAIHERFRKFREREQLRWDAANPLPPGFKLEVVWNPEEIVWIGSAMGVSLTVEEASRLLWRNRRRLTGGMDSAAYDIIRKLLSIPDSAK